MDSRRVCYIYISFVGLLLIYQFKEIICYNQLRLTGIKCIAIDKNFGEFKICNIKAVKRDIVEANLYLRVFKKPIKELVVFIKAFKRGFEHHRPLIDVKINLCTFYENQRHNPLADILLKVMSFSTYTNMNHTCPFDHDIIVDKYRFNQDYLRLLPFAVGSYRFATVWSVENKLITKVDIHLEVKEKIVDIKKQKKSFRIKINGER